MGAVASVTALVLVGATLATGARSATAATAAQPAPGTAYAVKGASLTDPKAAPKQPSMTTNGKASGAYKPSGTALPAAAAGHVALAAAASAAQARKSAIAGTPLWTQRVSAKTGPADVSARVLPQSTSKALGLDGVVFEASSPDTAGRVRIGVDYSGFKDAYGGNYGSRLQLFTLPACALTTPNVARCRVETPVSGATNDTSADSLSGVVNLPRVSTEASAADSVSDAASATPADGTQATVLAASSSPGQEGGATGSYGASSIAPSGYWTAGNSAGEFTYDYSITDPDTTSSLTPQVALEYDSGSVDGKTSLTEAQSSTVGDGWAAPADNYITQTFVPCDDSPEGSASPTSTTDLCYDGEVLSLELDGTSTTIVDDNGTFKLQNDDGAVITHVTDSNNGQNTHDTDYWEVTERDGSSYYFGMNQLPGYATAAHKTETNSVDYEPVFSTQSTGDPCYNSTWADSVCDMAYKWHLDYVTDAHGDAMSYYYGQDTNYYGENNGAKNAEYVRDSYLEEIDYGYTTTSGAYGVIPDKILFDNESRCVASSCPAISSSMSTTTAAADWPDVPMDLVCVSGQTCGIDAPSFFSTDRLASISTEQYSPSTSAYVPVDSYALAQDYPATGDSSSGTLWLESIKHTGDDTTAGGSTAAVPEPSVTFSGTDLPNRWDTATYPGLYRWRVDEITGELGAETSVTYSIPDACAANTSTEPSANPQTNTTSCYPIYWQPPGYSSPIEDWFIKYAVSEVTVSDETKSNEEEVTKYSYAGPAWHYDDNPGVKAADRTYGEFRGYHAVTTLTGNGTSEAQDKSTQLFYQGMYGDYLTPTTTSTTTVADSFGNAHNDYDALAGQSLELDVYRGDSTTLDTSTINDYWVSGATATQTLPGLPDVKAQMAQPAESFVQTMTTDGGTTGWDYSETDDSYDTTTTDADFGLLLDSYSHAWTSAANGADADDAGTDYAHCTTYTYAPANATENLVGLVATEQEVSEPCSGFTEGSPAWIPAGTFALAAPSFTQSQVVSASADFYDQNGSFTTTFAPQTTAPTVGDLTETAQASGYSGGAFTYQMETEAKYDSYGRPTDSYDGEGNDTVTTYTTTDGLTTADSVKNPLGQTTSETLDPTRALTLTATDENGVVTTRQYDALGRITAEWDDSRYSSTTTVKPNYAYSYTESQTGVSGSITQTLDDELGVALSATLVDSLGRVRQTQTSTPDGGMLVADTFYNSLGQVSQVDNSWWDQTATPSVAFATAPQAQIPNWDKYVYDGLGNQVEDQSMTLDTAVYDTTYTVYSGDAVTNVPDTTSISPIAGGAIATSQVDPSGRPDAAVSYSAGAAQPTLTVPSNLNTGVMYVSGGTPVTTSYKYDGQGNQATMKDADGDSWTDTYNLLGQLTTENDPTAGQLSNMLYDADGNLVQSEDSRGDYLSYTYDKLDRETAEYATTLAAQSGSTPMTSWAYDNSNGDVTNMTDPIGHVTTVTVNQGGQAYSLQYKGFNKFGESTGETYTLGSGAGQLAGTYQYSHFYSANTGLLQDTVYSAEANGTLPSETVSYGYSSTDGVNELSSVSSALGSYATNTSYDGYSRVSQLQMGTGADVATQNLSYDAHSGKLAQDQVLDSSTTNNNVDDVSYAYNTSGNVTSETDERSGSTADEETQCFDYDSLEQLTTAYTSTAGCTTAPTSSSHAMVGDALGSASTYWESWSYNNEGDRTGQDVHNLTNSADDTLTGYTYGNTGSTTQAHTLASTATTVNGAQTASTSYQYDTAGDMKSRTTAAAGTQTLSWNNAGQLTGVSSTTKGSSSYIYNADGGLLVQTDGTTTTVYLEDEQLSYNSATSAYGANRYYSLPGGGTAIRTGTGNNYQYQFSDQHGTNDLSLDFTAQDATWRQFDPYGNSRGGTGASWVDNRGFLNDPTDSATGLTDIGARWYDPTTGDFVSLDPLLDGADTLALGGYAYTDDDPVSEVDFSGAGIGDLAGYLSDFITITGGPSVYAAGKYLFNKYRSKTPGELPPGNNPASGEPESETPSTQPQSQPPTEPETEAENQAATQTEAETGASVGGEQSAASTEATANLAAAMNRLAAAQEAANAIELGKTQALNNNTDALNNLARAITENTNATQKAAYEREAAAEAERRAAAERAAEARAREEQEKESHGNGNGNGSNGGGDGEGSGGGDGGGRGGGSGADEADGSSTVAAEEEAEADDAAGNEAAAQAEDEDASGYDNAEEEEEQAAGDAYEAETAENQESLEDSQQSSQSSTSTDDFDDGGDVGDGGDEDGILDGIIDVIGL